MQKWIGKVAVVTGASGGIGAEIVKDLARNGVRTIGLARHHEKIDLLKNDLKPVDAENIYAHHCDISKESNVKSAFEFIGKKFGGVNILVNNAAILKNTMILSDNDSNDDFKEIVGTNLMGLAYCTREAYQFLKDKKDYGYIININSIGGHYVAYMPNVQPISNLYCGTKFAVTATSEVIRQELNYLKNNKVRVTSISPGYVKTNIFKTGGLGHFEADELPALIPEDISNAVLYVLGTPSRVQIKEIIIKPNGELY